MYNNMIKSIFNTIKEILARKPAYNTLESYIVANNPQTADDISRLERMYFDQQRRNSFGAFFHE